MYVYIYICICSFICIRVRIYMYIYMCVYTCMYVYMYTRMYVYTCMHIWRVAAAHKALTLKWLGFLRVSEAVHRLQRQRQELALRKEALLRATEEASPDKDRKALARVQHACTCFHVGTQVRIYPCLCVYIYAHTCLSNVYIHVYAYIQTYIHACMDAYTYLYIHVPYTCSCMSPYMR